MIIIISFILLLLLLIFLFSDNPIDYKYQVNKDYYNINKIKNNNSKIFLLTGSASGISRHLVKKLLKLGHIVIATDININGLEQAAIDDEWYNQLGDVNLLQLDVTDENNWKEIYNFIEEEYNGVLHVCFNIAGYLKPEFTQNLTNQGIDNHTNINLKGVVLGTCYASKLMINYPQPKGGHIINFSSLGSFAPVNGVGMYISSKYGVRGFSLAASTDLRPKNIFVSCICPDGVQTPMLDLQLNYKESRWGYTTDKPLTVEDIEYRIFNNVLPNRNELEIIGADFLRENGSRLSDLFPLSNLVFMIEKNMLKVGEKNQRLRKNIINYNLVKQNRKTKQI